MGSSLVRRGEPGLDFEEASYCGWVHYVSVDNREAMDDPDLAPKVFRNSVSASTKST